MQSEAEIDTSNQYFVGIRGNMITSMMLRQEFTREQALNLAAYLVTMAGMTAAGDADEDFAKVLEAIRNT